MTELSALTHDGNNAQVDTAVKRGYLWNLLNFAFSQGASLIIFILLSRAVSPTAFGVFVLAILFVDLIAEQGRWASIDAIVQRKDYSRAALATAFFVLLGICTLLTAITVMSAGQIASLLDEPGVAKVLPPLSVAFLFMPPIAVMEALLLRRLDFRAQALRSMAAVMCGGVVGLALAFSPAVEWALVAQRLTALGASVVMLFAFTRWVPTLTFDRVQAREFLSRAFRLWAAVVLATLHLRAAQASIGIRAGAGALGLLNVAQRFETALYGPITGPIQGMWVPVLSALRSDRAESWRLFLRLTQLTSLLALPAFVGLGLIGPDLAAVFLDQRYEKVGDILFVLGLQGFMIPVGFFSNLIFAGLDRSDLSLKFSIVQLCVTLPAVWVAASYGVICTLIVIYITVGTATAIATYAQIRLLGGSVKELVYALMPAYASGSFMVAIVILATDHSPFSPGLSRLVYLVIIGAAAYTAWMTAFYRREVMDAWRFGSSLRRAGEG